MIVLDKALYGKVKKEADKKFLAPTSAYKSAWIVREYKRLGGRFADTKDQNKGLLRWFREKWLDVNRGAPCGRPKATEQGTYPLCRPTVRVTKDTPKLAKDIPKQQIADANKKKQRVKNKGRIAF